MTNPTHLRSEEEALSHSFKASDCMPDEMVMPIARVRTLIKEKDDERDRDVREARKSNEVNVEIIKGYNTEKLQLIETLKRTGNEEFYLQDVIKRRLEKIDDSLQALNNPN